MNKTKECIYCKDQSTGMQFQPCYTCIDGSNFSATAKVIKPKKPQSLLKKYFLLWCKMSDLIYKIFILNRKCNKYPDLKKYRGHPDVKKIVRSWRSELKELERELKQLI